VVLPYGSESQQRLIQLEDTAKAAGLGKWEEGSGPAHTREVLWNVEEPRKLVESLRYKPVKGTLATIHKI